MGVLVLLYYGQGRLKHNGWHAGDSWQGDWRGRVAMELKGVKKSVREWAGDTLLWEVGWCGSFTARGVSFQTFYFAWLEIPSFLFKWIIHLFAKHGTSGFIGSVRLFFYIDTPTIYLSTSFLLLSLSLSALALPHGSLRCNVFSFHCSFILHLHLSTSTPNSINSTNNTASMRMAMSSCQWCLHIQS